MSIRFRLAIWYAASVLVLFLVTGILLRIALRATVEQGFERGAARSADLVHGFFRTEVVEYLTTEATVTHIASEIITPDMALDFIGPDGAVYMSSATASAIAREEPLEGPIITFVRPLDAELAPGWRLRVRASRARLDASLSRIDQSLLLVIPISVLLAALTGWWLTGRTLRPVGEMAAAAEALSTGTGHGRIPVANPRDELGRLATRFNTLVDTLHDALSQQRVFLAAAAHELRTPVARMLAEVEGLLSTDSARSGGADATEPSSRETLLLLRDDLRRTGDLVSELLQLARADAGEPAPPLANGYLDDAISEAVRPWLGTAARRGVQLDLPVLEEAPARFNAEHVSRLLGVLLDNAIRYTPAGGYVHVSVVRRASGEAVLEVCDSGVGIPESERSRIFERFYRGANARVIRPGGSGLGLAIAQTIAREHGARIEMESPPSGSGSCFRVVFPPVVITAAQAVR
ncbi:MAG TPA: HAMP domain-containing sensor histidine kinase [Gemmatimonadaceae bacterium]|nr:HAMP domain-containing sensor histidine kinase [Gemmatimonadaceae bacterium]